MSNILLIEPDYKNKYPPIGLMKISTYHKMLGDEVYFYKGKNPIFRDKKWDRIYISTLFTFYWDKTIDTIKYYLESTHNKEQIYVGGVMATLLQEEILQVKGLENIQIIKGLIDKPNILNNNDNIIIDTLIPDYSIIEYSDTQSYKYPVSDSYIAYSTRGCVNNCKFCVVPLIEPEYKDYISIKGQVNRIKELYGEKKDLLLLDNNVLASNRFEDIINEIIDLGYVQNDSYYYYEKNGKVYKKRKYVDFNQGVDARLINEKNMKLLSKVAIKPLRIAFDHANDEYVKIYIKAVKIAAKYGIKNLSNYLLFNFDDKPEDLYKRIEININLNEEFEKSPNEKGTKIFSFPMRYSPTSGYHSKDRKYVGKFWSPKKIRAIQCILAATHGVVGPKRSFFEKAYGKNVEEFNQLLLMPENYIIYRSKYKDLGYVNEWIEAYNNIKDNTEVTKIIESNNFKNIEMNLFSREERKLLSHYLKKGKSN